MEDSSRHDWKIVEWDVKNQNKQTKVTILSLTFNPFNPFIFFLESNVDLDQLASDEASWSGSTLLSAQIVNMCLQINRIKNREECVVHKKI